MEKRASTRRSTRELRFYLFAVPRRRRLAEVGFVGHVTSQRGVVSEDRIFGNAAVVAHGLEKRPQVRLQLIPGNAAEGETFRVGLFAGSGIVLFVPFLGVFLAQHLRKADSVVAGALVFAALRRIGDAMFGNL